MAASASTFSSRTANTARKRAPGRTVSRFAVDWSIVVGLIGLYFVARGIAPDRPEQAMALSLRLVEIERALRIFVEPEVQAISIRSFWVKEIANFIYAYLHFPVLAAVGLWLWWRGRERFVFLRNVIVLSMLIGLAFYYLLPAAPPRLMALHGHDLGFIDTIFGGDTAVSYAQPSFIQNDYAAVPSFHFGWIALASAAIWVNMRSRFWRATAVLLAVAMTWAILATANHFILDLVAGGLVIAAAWRIGRDAGRWTRALKCVFGSGAPARARSRSGVRPSMDHQRDEWAAKAHLRRLHDGGSTTVDRRSA